MDRTKESELDPVEVEADWRIMAKLISLESFFSKVALIVIFVLYILCIHFYLCILAAEFPFRVTNSGVTYPISSYTHQAKTDIFTAEKHFYSFLQKTSTL